MKTKATETKSKSTAGVAHLLTWIMCLGALILSCASGPAQNLFVSSDAAGGNIYEFTPAGGRTTFASGFTNPEAVAFDNAGNLFVSAGIFGTSTGAIYKITSGGVRSTFAIGFSPFAPMACDSAGNMFVSDFGGNIYKFTPDGMRSTFATGVSGALAFQPPQTPTPTLVNISTRGS